MIYGTLKEKGRYAFLDEKIKRCFQFACEQDLGSFETGSHPVDGEEIYVNIAEYETVEVKARFWEAHRRYLDLHVMLRGEECVEIGFLQTMRAGEYVPGDDFLPLEGTPSARVRLGPGDFLLCYPEDGHKTGVQWEAPQQIKKAIFKIRIK